MEDNVAILADNFGKIDAVFGGEVPICGVNMKHLWCEYTCNPNKGNYVNATGYATQEWTGTRLTQVTFSVDENTACTLFQICKMVSLIAQASIQSSLSFLDFLGVNGLNQSLSVINFVFDTFDNGTFQGAPLNYTAYPCDYDVPDDGVIDNYTKIENSTCSHC